MARLAKLSRYGATAGGLALLALSTGAGQPQGNPDYGFVLTDMNMLFYRGDEKIDCPQGRSPSVREAFLAALTQPSVDRGSLEDLRRAELQLAEGASQRIVTALADIADVLTPEQRAELVKMAQRWRH